MRASLLLLCSITALAQQEPLDKVLQSAWQFDAAHFREAAAARENARSLLQHVPPGSPRFPSWAQQVAQLYQNAGMNRQAHSILHDALDRTAPLGETNPRRFALLDAMGLSWLQDGNLLKAVGYMERAAAAQASPAPQGTAQPGEHSDYYLSGLIGAFSGGVSYGTDTYAYIRLASLYQQLGRPDAVAAVIAKLREHPLKDPCALAGFLEQYGKTDEAAAIYRKVAEQSADPGTKVSAWQGLANLYARQQRYTDAIAAMQEGIATAQLAPQRGLSYQSVWMRQTLAGYMQSAGLRDQADQVYQSLLQQSQGSQSEARVVNDYARYLADTERGPESEKLLTEYMAGRPTLDQNLKANMLFNLASSARKRGDGKAADEYQQSAQPQRSFQPPPGQIRISEFIEKAHTALNQSRWDDAYALTVQALDIADQAVDGQQVEWQAPQIAERLAANKEPAKGEQIFQRLLATAQDSSRYRLLPLLNVTRSYVDFLTRQPDRAAEVPAAIELYRRLLADANGAESASLADPLRTRMAFERSRLQWEQAYATARELLELQASLSGTTSAPYLVDLQKVAHVYEGAGDSSRALTLFRQAIPLADALATPNNNLSASQARIDAAMALARMGQFDEADALAAEAVVLRRNTHPPGPSPVSELEAIRRMKQAAANANRGVR